MDGNVRLPDDWEIRRKCDPSVAQAKLDEARARVEALERELTRQEAEAAILGKAAEKELKKLKAAAEKERNADYHHPERGQIFPQGRRKLRRSGAQFSVRDQRARSTTGDRYTLGQALDNVSRRSTGSPLPLRAMTMPHVGW